MKKFFSILVAILALGVVPGFAFAENKINLSLPPGTQQALSGLTNNAYLTFNNIFTFVFGLGFGIATLGLIANGIRYVAAFGNDEQVEKAKNGVYYSILGLVILLLALTITATINYIFVQQ